MGSLDKLEWYPWFPLSFRRKTYRLSLAEDGAYRRLIDEYMITRQPLPNDDGALARILGIPTTEWDVVKVRVRSFFKARNDKLRHDRCEQELRAQVLRNKQNSDRGKKAAFSRWSKINNLNARPMLAPATLQRKIITSTEYVEGGTVEKPESEAVRRMRERLERKQRA